MTGALDSAARFASFAGPISALVNRYPRAKESFAVSSNTRECYDETQACMTVSRLSPYLANVAIAFKKIDSLMRGHPLAEMMAIVNAAKFDRCLLAPAFPDEGRVTIEGRQWLVKSNNPPEPVGPDLVAALQERGVRTALLHVGDNSINKDASVIVCDATSENHLRNAVRIFRKETGRHLYCGTAGLAGSLPTPSMPLPECALETPVLVIVGSVHPVTVGQIKRLLGAQPPSRPDPRYDAVRSADSAVRVTSIAGSFDLMSFEFGSGVARYEADRRIAGTIRGLVNSIVAPPTLLVVGGETLSRVAQVLNIESFLVRGEYEPGIPASKIVGGPWNGTQVISKSGAFGERDVLLRRLLSRQSL